MKKITALILTLSFLIMAGCSDDDSKPNVNGNATAVANNLKSGAWRITNFVEDGSDELVHFQGYNFTFGTNNVLTATNGTNTYTGTWSVVDDHSNDDNNSGDIELNIAFASPDTFNELTEDWKVSARTGVRIDLYHVSGNDGRGDYLTFEKK